MNVSTDQILAHRKGRKDSGLVGCMDGSDININSLGGISWRPADPMDPPCFCHDCRSMWDSDGTIDQELIKKGSARALFTYSSILPDKKEVLRDLRSKTDDALETFVKTQMELFAKMDEIKEAQAEYNRKSDALSEMNSHGYSFLKAYEGEIDRMGHDLFIRHNHIQTLSTEEFALEEKCREAEAELTNARKAEREFIEKFF